MGPSYIDENGEVQYGFKTPFNHNTLAEAKASGQKNTEPSKTQQQFKEDSDINTIVARFLKTGLIAQVQMPIQYGDLTTMEDYHTMANKLADTNALFYALPAEQRSKFQNDPGRWLGWVNEQVNAGNLDPLREMGLDVPEATTELPATPAPAAAPGNPTGAPPAGGTPAPATPSAAS